MGRITRWTVVLAAVAMLGVACGGGGDGGDAGDGGQPQSADTLVMVDNAFQPENWLISPGTYTVTNEGQALHSFTLEEEGIDEDVNPGESTEIDLQLDPGEYDFICKYHPEMTGTLTVE